MNPLRGIQLHQVRVPARFCSQAIQGRLAAANQVRTFRFTLHNPHVRYSPRSRRRLEPGIQASNQSSAKRGNLGQPRIAKEKSWVVPFRNWDEKRNGLCRPMKAPYS
jgi:hypothetical protein